MLFLLPGFFVGLLVWTRVAHLLQAFSGVDGESKTRESEAPAWTRKQSGLTWLNMTLTHGRKLQKTGPNWWQQV